MSSNLIKLAPKYFLIFLICLDKTIVKAEVLDEGLKKNLCNGLVLHETRLRFFCAFFQIRFSRFIGIIRLINGEKVYFTIYLSGIWTLSHFFFI